MHQEPLYKAHLRQELNRRKAGNPLYSLRSFAASLDVSPGSLSRTFNGKASLAVDTLERILMKTCSSDLDRSRYLKSFLEEQQSATIKKISIKILSDKKTIIPEEIESSVVDVLCDWTHYAILELSDIDGFKLSAKSAAQALGIDSEAAGTTILRLLQVGLLKRHKNKLQKTKEILINKNRGFVNSASIRACLDQSLQLAQKSLHSDPLSERNMTSMTIPIDPDKIPMAKVMIDQFVMHMSEYLSSGRKRRVYNLNINLFPVQKITTKKLSPLLHG